MEMFAEIVDAAQPFHEPGIVRPADEAVLLFLHVLRVAGHVADDFLQHVVQRHQTGKHAVLVDDDRLVHALVVEMPEHLHEGERLGNVHRLAQHRPHGVADGAAGMPVAVHEDVAHVHDAQEIIERAPPYGQAEMGRLLQHAPDLLRRILDVDPRELRPGGHAVRRGEVVQLEHPVHEDGLRLVERPHARPLPEQHPDFFFRHGLLLIHVDAEETDDDLRRPRAEHDERPAQRGKHEHGLRDGAGRLLRDGDGQPLRRELAQDERGVRHERNDDGHSEPLRVRRDRGNLPQLRRERHRQRRPGKHPRENADGGDADLNGGKKILRIVRDLQRVLRLLISLLRHLAELRLPRAHHGDLRHGAYPVENNEYKNNENFRPYVAAVFHNRHPFFCESPAPPAEGRAVSPVNDIIA